MGVVSVNNCTALAKNSPVMTHQLQRERVTLASHEQMNKSTQVLVRESKHLAERICSPRRYPKLAQSTLTSEGSKG